MSGILGLAGGFRPYLWIAAAVALSVALGASYLRGRTDGRSAEAVHWQQLEIERQQQQARERFALQEALDTRTAELAQRQQEAADAVAQVRVEYLPGKTVVRKEVVERPVFRDCRVGDGVLSTINAALRGAPVADAPGGGGADGMPAGTSHDGG